LFIYGASGHAKVVIDVAEKMGVWQIRGVLDDNPALAGSEFLSYPILGGIECLDALNREQDFIFVAIGSNAVRQRIANSLIAKGFSLPILIHPSATVGRDVSVGYGSVVMAGVVINPSTQIGALCILNTACSVDHDGKLGAAVHISPGAHLAGSVTVGEQSWVGIGSSIIEGRMIGCRSIIGAGAVVVDDIPDDVTVVGVPARPIRERRFVSNPGGGVA